MTNKIEISSIIKGRTLGLVFVLGAASLAFAQQKVNVSGKVISKGNIAVPYASVSFSNKANKLYSDATLTDEKGQYQIALTPGDYEITIEAIDFKTSKINKQISSGGSLGDFSVEAESSLTNTKTQDIQGVTITASAVKPYRVEIDKKVYDPSTDLVSKGGNLQDVLANVPSVSVDTDGTVSMRGSSNVKFLINGKPSALLGIDDGANALQSIPADQIERIEVITNPSSKFEAGGTAGILNIILKKNKKVGFNGSVTGSIGYFPRTSLNTNLSWRKGDFTFFLNGGGGYSRSRSTNSNDTWFKNVVTNGDFTEIHQSTKNKSENSNYNATTGFLYDISDKTSINASGTIRTFEGLSNATINYDYLRLNQPALFNQRLTDGNSQNLALQGDFGLDHKFDDKGQNISLSLSLQRNRSENDNNIQEFNNHIFQLNDLTNQKQLTKSVVGKVDYELPIGEMSKLEAGYRLDLNHNNYDNHVLESTSQNPDYIYLPKFTNLTDYKENFNAVYAQFKSKIGNLGYQLGLRNEYSIVNIDYSNLAGDVLQKEKKYNNLFPSVFLSYELSKDNQFLLNYSRRIDRPRSWFLVPYFSLTDNQNLFLGNVDLNPGYVNSFEFGYSISKRKFTINPTLYYRHETDDTKMINYRPDERENVFYTQPFNIGTDNRYGLDLNFSADPFSWLKLMGSVDLYGYKSEGFFTYNAIDQNGQNVVRNLDKSGNGFSTRMRLNTTFKLDKTLSVQLQGFYRGGEVTASDKQDAMYALNLGASKTIWNGDGTFSFNIQDIFNTRGRTFYSYTPDYDRKSYMQWSPRQFSLTFTYRFKQGDKVEQPRKKKDINANEQGGDDQGPPM